MSRCDWCLNEVTNLSVGLLVRVHKHTGAQDLELFLWTGWQSSNQRFQKQQRRRLFGFLQGGNETRLKTETPRAALATFKGQSVFFFFFYIFLPWSLTGLTGLVSVCPVFWSLHDSRQGPAVLTSGSCSLHQLLMLLFSGLEATLDLARVRND